MSSLKILVLLAAALSVVSCADGYDEWRRGRDNAADAAAADASAADAGAAETGSSACAKCAANEICVAGYDGTCIVLGVSCRPKTTSCTSATCSPDCNRYLCGAGGDGAVPLSCATTHCAGKTPVAGAFGCYGP